MLNDKDTQDLIKYLTLMTDLNSDAEGRKILSRIEYLELMAFEVALRALSRPFISTEKMTDEQIKKEIDNAASHFLCGSHEVDSRWDLNAKEKGRIAGNDESDDKLLGEVKMTMPTTEPHRCNHIWWWNPATMKHICSKCHVKQERLQEGEF